MEALRGSKGIIFCSAGIIALIILLTLLPSGVQVRLTQENGLIEDLSVVGYLLAACWLLVCGYSNRLAHGYFSGVMVTLLALRELDFHARFTTMGIFKTRYYLSDKVPVPEKIIVALVVTALIAAVIWYLRKYGPKFLQALRQRSDWAICIALAIASAVLSKTFDRCSDEISELFVAAIDVNTDALMKVSEETLELGIPLFLLLAIMNGLAERSINDPV